MAAKLTSKDFDRRVLARGLVSVAIPAARDVLVRGLSNIDAARKHGVGAGLLWKLCQRIRETKVCAHCRQAIVDMPDEFSLVNSAVASQAITSKRRSSTARQRRLSSRANPRQR